MIILMLFATGMAMYQANHRFSEQEMEVIRRYQHMEHQDIQQNQGIQQNQPKQNWHCPACTFFNSKDSNKCGMCEALPGINEVHNYEPMLIQDHLIQNYIQQQPLVDVDAEWSCEKCTTINVLENDECSMCFTVKPDYIARVPTIIVDINSDYYNIPELKLLQDSMRANLKHKMQFLEENDKNQCEYVQYQCESKTPGLWYVKKFGENQNDWVEGKLVNEEKDFNNKLHYTGTAVYKVPGKKSVYMCDIDSFAEGKCISMDNFNSRGLRQVPKYYFLSDTHELILMDQKVADQIEDVRMHMEFNGAPVKAHIVNKQTMTLNKSNEFERKPRALLVTEGFKLFDPNAEEYYLIYPNGAVVFTARTEEKKYYMKQQVVKSKKAQVSIPARFEPSQRAFNYVKYINTKRGPLKTDVLTSEMSEKIYEEVLKISRGEKRQSMMMHYVTIGGLQLDERREAIREVSPFQQLPQELEAHGSVSLDKKYRIQINIAGDVTMTDVSDFIQEGATRNWPLRKENKLEQASNVNECPICFSNENNYERVCKNGHLTCSACALYITNDTGLTGQKCPMGCKRADFIHDNREVIQPAKIMTECMVEGCLNKPHLFSRETQTINACSEHGTAFHNRQRYLLL